MTFESTLESLADPDQRLTSGLLVPLSTLDREQTQELREIWPEIDATRRVRILNELSTLSEDNVDLNFDPIFRLALDDQEPELRLAALHGLIEYENRDLIFPLINLVQNDEDPAVRAEAAVGLGRYALAAGLDQLNASDARTVRDVLIQIAEDTDEDENVRANAIEAVGAMSDDEIDNLIESIYEEESIYLKIGAVDAMGRSCNTVWLPIVMKEMENHAPLMRHAAAFAAGAIGDDSAISELQRVAIQDPDKDVRLIAVGALGEIGGRRSTAALKAVLYEGHDDLREAVQEALTEIAFNDDPLGSI